MDWFTAAQVTVNNGESIVRVNSGEAVAAIRAHDSLEVGQFNGVDILNTYTEDVTGDQIIQLVKVWPHASQVTQPAQVVPTAVNFNSGAQILSDTKDKVFAQLASFFAFGSQATGTVTFNGITISDPDITIRSLGQFSADITALEQQAQGSVDDVNAIDAQVNGAGGLVEVTAQAVADLAAIDSTLQGYVSTVSGYQSDVSTWRAEVSTWHGNVSTWHTTINDWHTDINGWKTNTFDYKELALQYRNEAEAFKNQAGEIVGGDYVTRSTTVNGKALTNNIALNAADIGLNNVDNTSDADKQTAILAAATKSDVDLNNVDNTSDADKQTAILAAATKSDVDLSEVDNTSDADKEISNATQAALDEIEIFALAGMAL